MAFILEKLTTDHDCGQFSCGVPVLDSWLIEHSIDSEKRGTASAYVWHNGDNVVVAYFALSLCVVKREQAPKAIARGSPDEVPAILLGKLALHKNLQNKKLGSELLHSAFNVVLLSTETITARIFVVDALDENVAKFYEHHGFRAFMDSRVRLARKINDIRKELSRDSSLRSE